MNCGTRLWQIAIVVGLLLTTLLRGTAQEHLNRSATQWSPFIEWSLSNDSFNGNPFDLVATVTFAHQQTGRSHTTGMFYSGGKTWQFRFTATLPGTWTFTTTSTDIDLDGRSGTITVEPNDDNFGFVANIGNKWARPIGTEGQLRAFIPQFVMYGHPATFWQKPALIDRDIDTFMHRHGFTGFHEESEKRRASNRWCHLRYAFW